MMLKFLLAFSLASLFFIEIGFSQKKAKIKIIKQDSLEIRNVVVVKAEVKNAENSDFLEKNMAWVAAIIVGLLTTTGTLYIGVHQRRSNERSLQKQLKENGEQLEKQMNLSLDLQKLQYKNTLAASNRQEWINDLRTSISEFLSKATLIFIDKKNATHGFEANIKDLEKLIFLKNKIELLLNIDHNEQKAVRDSIWNILNEVEKSDLTLKKLSKLQETVISCSSILFQMQWEKIKNAE